ncbi:MAG: hypothetical protein BMS9Abin25_1012 [Gammaproteobacteria bacterium]|nr:MAG: hypothetical protein BMS9Abin25_1012 [Gammaproteobacteria bacterium]
MQQIKRMKSLATWFRNRRFRVRQSTARYPWIFYTLYQLSPVNRKLMVTRNTRITIEGYPRSANTFAVYAFKHVNEMQWNEVAHHLHVQAQITRSIKYKIPVILLIRHPLEAVRSLVVRHDFIPVDEALEDYYRFYNDLYSLKDGFVVAHFDMVTNHYGEIIEQVNKKFSSEFNLYPEQDDEMNAAVLNEIDVRNRQLDKGKVTHLYRPDKDKEALKNLVDLEENNELFQKALGIYKKYIEIQ